MFPASHQSGESRNETRTQDRSVPTLRTRTRAVTGKDPRLRAKPLFLFATPAHEPVSEFNTFTRTETTPRPSPMKRARRHLSSDVIPSTGQPLSLAQKRCTSIERLPSRSEHSSTDATGSTDKVPRPLTLGERTKDRATHALRRNATHTARSKGTSNDELDVTPPRSRIPSLSIANVDVKGKTVERGLTAGLGPAYTRQDLWWRVNNTLAGPIGSPDPSSKSDKQRVVKAIEEQLAIETRLLLGSENMLKAREKAIQGKTISERDVSRQLEISKKKVEVLQNLLEECKNASEIARLPEKVKRPQDGSKSKDKKKHTQMDPGTLRKPVDVSGPASGNRAGGRPSDSTSMSPSGRQVLAHDGERSFWHPGDVSLATASGTSDGIPATPTSDFTFEEFFYQLGASSSASVTRLESLNTYIHLIAKGYHRGYISIWDQMLLLRHFLSDRSRDIRAATYRCFRHLAVNKQSVESMLETHIEFFIIRSLAREPQKFEREREQAVKLVRKWASITKGDIPGTVLRMLVAISEQLEDRLRVICVETLCEIALERLPLVVQCGGLKVMCDGLMEEPRELSDLLATTLLYLVDKEGTRRCFRPGVEVEVILSHLTDIYNKNTLYEQRLVTCLRCISTIIKSWSGLVYFCSEGKRAIKAIVEALSLEVEELRRTILDMLFSLFRIEVPHWLPDAMSSKLCSQNLVSIHNRLRRKLKERQQDRNRGPLPYVGRLDLVNHYTAILLQVFIEAGLLESLVHIIRSSAWHSAAKATILVAEIISLGNTFLPSAVGARIHSLPSLFKLASSFHADKVGRHSALRAFAHIDSVPQIKNGDALFSGLADPGYTTGSGSATSLTAPSNGMERRVDNLKLQVGYNMDDIHFRNLVNECNILNTRDYEKWNWEVTNELIQGPLRNPRRLEESIRSTKLIKRLLSFFKPSKRQFSEIPMNTNRGIYVSVGTALLDTLLTSSEGVKYLAEHPFLSELSQCLRQLDSTLGPKPRNVTFSEENMETSLTREYFKLLGIFTRDESGITLLEGFRVFNVLYNLDSMRRRDYVVRNIIQSMDYSTEGHCRIIFSHVMTSGSYPMRLFATNYLCDILRSGLDDFANWGVPLLISQLYDPHVQVCQAAVNVLDEACNDERNLHAMIRSSPTLDHLGEIGNTLCLRFLSTPEGFHSLSRLGYIEREMAHWFATGNLNYVLRLELSLYKALNDFRKPNLSNSMFGRRVLGEPKVDAQFATTWTPMSPDLLLNAGTGCAGKGMRHTSGLTPPHFYGELTKTEEGCALLRRSGHFHVFVKSVEDMLQRREVEVDEDTILLLKAALWAIGTIGATKMGALFLQEYDAVRKIALLAESCGTYSIKGTCFHVLGLISQQQRSWDALEELGWQPGVAGISLPKRVDRFMRSPELEYPVRHQGTGIRSFKCQLGDEQMEVDIMKSIGNMSNHILANAALKQLSKHRQDHPEYFQRPKLFLGAMHLLGAYHYKLTAQRYVHDMFRETSLADYVMTQRTLEDLRQGPLDQSRSREASLSGITVNGRSKAAGGVATDSMRIETSGVDASLWHPDKRDDRGATPAPQKSSPRCLDSAPAPEELTISGQCLDELTEDGEVDEQDESDLGGVGGADNVEPPKTSSLIGGSQHSSIGGSNGSPLESEADASQSSSDKRKFFGEHERTKLPVRKAEEGGNRGASSEDEASNAQLTFNIPLPPGFTEDVIPKWNPSLYRAKPSAPAEGTATNLRCEDGSKSDAAVGCYIPGGFEI